MGVWTRLKLLFNAELSGAPGRAEDPRRILDYAYSQQRELLVILRRGLVDVATSKHELEQQARKLEARIPQLDERAFRAVTAGRDDLARVALKRKRLAMSEIEGLTKQIAEVEADKQRLAAQERSLHVRIEQFRTHRDIISARNTGDEAEVRLREALAGVSGELAELGMAVGRAEEKTERFHARARAIDSLLEIGSMPPINDGDFVESELLQITISSEVDEELATIKAEFARAYAESAEEERP